jgi:hypothetical protein
MNPTDTKTAAQNADHWSYILPAMPLEIAVPVRNERGYKRIVVAVHPVLILAPGVKGLDTTSAENTVRVDLSDPQGFAYAIRVLRGRPRWYEAVSVDLGSLVDRWLRGETTDADRYALAQALADRD